MRILPTTFLLLAISGLAFADKPPVKNVIPSTRVPCNLGVIRYDWDFSLGDQGFNITECDQSGVGVWEWGPTSYVPGAPTNVWGTLLEADYENDSGQGLVSPSWVVTAQAYLVEVYHYYDTESTYDGCNLVISPYGTVWEPIGGYPVQQISPDPDYYAWCVDLEPGWTGASGSWRVDCFDLSEYMDQEIAVELDFGSDAIVTRPGWYVGAVRVGTAAGATGVCCKLATGDCDISTVEQCLESGGVWHPEWGSCQPSPCPQPCNLEVVSFDWDFATSDHSFQGVDCDNGGASVWEWGPTTYIPGATGRVWGTILNANYPNDSGLGLASPSFNVGPDSYLVEVYHYFDIENTYDGCNVSVGTWPNSQIIHPVAGYTVPQISASPNFYAYCVDMEPGWTGASGNWRVDCFDLSAYMGNAINLEFDFGSDATTTRPGWYISRVRVGGISPPEAACCDPATGDCSILTQAECAAMAGVWHPEWASCDPNPCPLPSGLPCEDCGPGDHWIDQCNAGVDYVADQAAKVGIDLDLDPNCVADVSLVMHPCPAPDDRVVIQRSSPRDDSYLYPGTRPLDGHLDVIDTEIVSMCLTAGGVTLRAGAGQGHGANLPNSYGVIAEQVGDPTLGDSFFDVFFEVDLGGGVYVYNHEPLRISGEIDCVPPQVGYIHTVDCLPLYTDPIGGQHVANLTSAEHVVNPGEDPAVCCLEDGCQIMLMDECFAANGFFHPEWDSCQPDPCPPPPPGLPCANCGPGDHWVDQCSAGVDHVADQAAKVGIDLDLDPNCVADVSLVMYPCPAPDDRVVIQRSDPRDDSMRYPGTRPLDGHLDVIDTEILSMCLTAGGVTLRAGAGQGHGANLPNSYGAIAEIPGDPTLGDSFFDVFFEVDLGGGVYVYNHAPMRISGEIDCIPPQVGYIHTVDCLPLYTDPIGGQHVANLTSAEHVVNPGEDPAVCCLESGCQIMPMDECFAAEGFFHPEWDSCQPDPCPTTGVLDESGQLVGTTALYSAIPNPFTGATELRYYVAQPDQLDIEIYDATGRHVRRLFSSVVEAGPGSVEWDGRNDAGDRVGSGVYYARLRAGGEVRSQRMLILK